ncbi:transglycosylase domain-containing protein [Candidatus Solirubrobacter pratensis]|uniref:transglycosylase domain-containing protein n=1 Tax=Candidatus Solirubrobacter pratensis TaxID=1298857 RepID=UPI000421266D|nr:transglycosylase domain-containing protein [Candidatus Solirubrobacter pratensis]
MDDHDDRTTTLAGPHGSADGNGDGGAQVVQFPRQKRGFPLGRRRREKRFRIRKLRLLIVLFGLGLLAIVSALFGMLMAVASDLPHLEAPAHENSVILSHDNKTIGTLTGNERRIYLQEDQIAPVMKHAIIAIEDQRFYTNDGVDLRGIARAAVQDVTSKQAAQGASTIPQQFVKIQLAAENDRTVFQKLREAALAYHLSHKWSKERILRDYLNAIYFGNGAYGIESAARTYFQAAHDETDPCGDRGQPMCASRLRPEEAALLAGIVQSPSGNDPIAHPVAAKRRRDVVLLRMLQQGYITRPQYDDAIRAQLPTRDKLSFPVEDTDYPYFTSWVKQQVVDQLGGGQQGAQKAFGGGLKVKTTIDTRLQSAAEAAIKQWLPAPDGPRAALVAIHNEDGEVRAMVGGDDYPDAPFNLATQGQRQPGSSFKPFVLARALEDGISPQSTWESKKKTYVLKGGERFTVNNYNDAYAGLTTLASATTYSDNAVFVQVGMKVRPARVATLARRMGIRTPISHNFALPLGGLREGVTPLDMAHAYETFATGGTLVYGSMSPGLGRGKIPPGPVGIERIDGTDGKAVDLPEGGKAINRKKTRPVLKDGIANEVGAILQTVVQKGSGTRAQIPGVVIAGKTGTTENYGDAWFVGWTKEYTVAVWVGYPDKFKPMKTEFQGEAVAGGTYPAGIWKTFMEGLLKVDKLPDTKPSDPALDGGTATTPPPTEGAAPSATPVPTATPAGGATGGAGAGGAATPPPAGGAGGTTPPADGGTGTGEGATTPPATGGGGTTPPATGGAGGTGAAPPAATPPTGTG